MTFESPCELTICLSKFISKVEKGCLVRKNWSLIEIIGLRNFRIIVLENFGIECLANQYIRVFETIEKLGKVNKK